MASDKSKQVNAFLKDGKVGLLRALALTPEFAPKPIAILVAISGGIDSTALLLMLNSLKNDLQLQLSACHVNHHLRAEESDKDEAFCHELCSQLQIPLTIEHLEQSGETSTVSEEKLRQARYERLTKIAQEKGIHLVATAHTKDDQTETLLFRLFRGTGKPGLVGMPISRALAEDITLIRPMLSISRADCEVYLESCGQSARHDSSNNNLAYRRNFIRHNVIPVIKEQFSNLAESLERFRSLNEEEEVFFSAAVESAFAELSPADLNKWTRKIFLAFPPAIQRRVLWQALRFRDIEPSYERIEGCRKAIADTSAISLDDLWDLRATTDTIFWHDKEQIKEDVEPWQIELKIPGITPLLPLNHALKIEALEEPVSTFPAKGELSAIADLSQVSFPLVVRTRMAGDAIQPFGMQEMVKLKKYLHNHKPESLPNPFANIVVADQKEVLWVPGIGLSNKLKVVGSPSHLLTWLKLAADCAIC